MSLDENKREKFPLLVIHHGDNKQEQTFCNILENKSYVTSIPELRNKKICACCRDEWLVLRDFDSGDCYLWNPSSEDKIQLPPLPKYKYLKCLLSAPPRDPECLVLFVISQTALDDDDPDDENSDNDDDDDDDPEDENPDDDDITFTFYFCRPGYNQQFHKQQLTQDNELESWIVCKGKFYGLTSHGSMLVRLDPDNDSGIVMVTPVAMEPMPTRSGYQDIMHARGQLIHQSSCDDDAELFYVRESYCGYIMEEVDEFQVFRFDFVKNVWLPVESIGDTAIFLSGSWGITCSTRGTNLMKGFIYHIESRCLYVINVETGDLSVSLPCQHVSETKPWSYWLNVSYKTVDRFL
ncbi:hypothetical protein P3S67_000199 [Capsicum chacoense]